MSEENKQPYPLSITPLFKAGFRQQSLEINAEIMEKLAQVAPGGKLIIRTLKEESRASNRSPVAYLEYLTPTEVAQAKTKYEEYKNSNTSGGI